MTTQTTTTHPTQPTPTQPNEAPPRSIIYKKDPRGKLLYCTKCGCLYRPEVDQPNLNPAHPDNACPVCIREERWLNEIEYFCPQCDDPVDAKGHYCKACKARGWGTAEANPDLVNVLRKWKKRKRPLTAQALEREEGFSPAIAYGMLRRGVETGLLTISTEKHGRQRIYLPTELLPGRKIKKINKGNGGGKPGRPKKESKVVDNPDSTALNNDDVETNPNPRKRDDD